MTGHFHQKAEDYPSELVRRSDIKRFSDNLYTANTMRSYDSLGKGPGGRVKIGGRVAYRKYKLAAWLDARVQVIDADPDPFA
jgi:hypothetical protein